MDTDQNPISLKLNKPYITPEPNILLRGLLIAGEYQFQLTVRDQAGNSSQIAIVKVVVKPPSTFWLKLRSWLARLIRLLVKVFP